MIEHKDFLDKAFEFGYSTFFLIKKYGILFLLGCTLILCLASILTTAQSDIDLGEIKHIAWNPAGTLYVASNSISGCSQESTPEQDIFIINANTDSPIRRLTGLRCSTDILGWNHNGTRLVRLSARHYVTVWNVATGEMLSSTGTGSNGSHTTSVYWHPSRNLLLYTTVVATVNRSGYSFIVGEDTSEIIGDCCGASTSFVNAIWYPPTDNLLIGEDDGDVVMWDVETNSPITTIATYPSVPSRMHLSPNNQYIAIRNYRDGIISIVDIAEQTITLQITIEHAYDVSWNPDSTHLAIVTPNRLEILELASGQFSTGIDYAEQIHSVAWHPYSDEILVGGNNRIYKEMIMP